MSTIRSGPAEVVGVRLPELLGQGPGLDFVEAVVVQVQGLLGGHLDHQQVAGGVDGPGGAAGDAGQQLGQVVDRQQVRGRREHLLEALAHLAQLLLQPGHPGLGVHLELGAGFDYALLVPGHRVQAGAVVDERGPLPGLPGDAVEAEPAATGLALGLGHHRRHQTEEDGDLGEQALGELAHVDVPGEPRPGQGLDHGVGVAHLEGLEGGHRGELGRRRRHVAQQLGRRAEGAQQVGHVGAVVLAQHLLADVAADVGVTGHLAGRGQQGDGLLMGAPAARVLEHLGRPGLAGGGQHLGHAEVADPAADVAHDDAGDGPGDVLAASKSSPVAPLTVMRRRLPSCRFRRPPGPSVRAGAILPPRAPRRARAPGTSGAYDRRHDRQCDRAGDRRSRGGLAVHR